MVHFIKTLNLAKLTRGKPFKTRCPMAMKMIRSIAARTAQVEEKNVIIGEEVNLIVWSQGIRTPVRRVRLDMEVQEREDKKYCVVTYVQVPEDTQFHNLLDEKNDD